MKLNFVKQKQRGLLNLEPEYQRGFVWDKASSSRLVETILLGLPVPEVRFLLMLLDVLFLKDPSKIRDSTP